MRKLVSGLALFVAYATTLSGNMSSDRTFLATRDELSYQVIEWITNNHYRTEKGAALFGGLLTVTPFYSVSTNKSDLAYLFGCGTTSTIDVAQAPLKSWSHAGLGDNFANVQHQSLYSFNVDHCPNCDGETSGQTPMTGRLLLAPERRAWGAYLSVDQSLENILKGLRLRISTPIADVHSSMNTQEVSSTPSIVPAATDGPTGPTITDFFSGAFSKGVSTYSHVLQKALVRGKMKQGFAHAFGLGDIELRLNWNAYSHDRFDYTTGAGIQVPTGNTMSNEYFFEPQLGARNHFAFISTNNLQIHAFSNDDIRVELSLIADFKYFFEGTERRMASVYDKTNAVVLPASPYRLVMRHKYSGVQPAANVMTLDHTVKPGFQLDGIFGISTAWKNWKFDIAYNLYWREEEIVTLKASDTWADDTYAFAHNHYSVFPSALGGFILGGTSTDSDGFVVHSNAARTGSSYNDPKSPIDKHQQFIGANGNPDGTPLRVSSSHTGSDGYYPGAFTSMNGPIQNYGKNTSALSNRVADPHSGDGTGVDSNDDGTQAVRYALTTNYAKTAAVITHAIAGGVSYQLQGEYPVILGIGGLAELQESNRNSGLEGFRVWAKPGMQF